MSGILVTGASGSVGGHAVAGLVAAGVPVRALVRRDVSVVGATTVRGDLGDPASLTAAAAGTEAVLLIWPGSGVLPEAVQALAEGRRVVLLSAINAGQGDGGTYRATEVAVETYADAWTHLRGGGFAKNALGWAPAVRARGPVRVPFPGAGRSSVHERDVADVAVSVLTGAGGGAAAAVGDGAGGGTGDGAGGGTGDGTGGGTGLRAHDGAIYDLTGPETLTLREHVAAIAAELGRDIALEQQPRAEAAAEITAWANPETAEAMLGYWETLVDHPEPVSPDVEKILGRPARSFAEWAADHRADFT